MNNQASTINNVVNSCIQVQEERISRRSTIPRQIYFRLDPDIISKIEKIQENNSKFALSPNKLTNLRYYVFLTSPITEKLSPIYSRQSSKPMLFEQSSLTFSTSYLALANQQPVTVVRSAIDWEGQISQQIQQDLWHNPQLLYRVINAHYWLILQIIAQLPLKSKNHISWLVWGLWLPIAFVVSMAIWFFLPLNYLLKIIITFGVFYILKIYLKYLIKNKLKSWIIYHLIYGCLANKVKKRQIGFKLLGFIV